MRMLIDCALISRTDGWPVSPCISPSHILCSVFSIELWKMCHIKDCKLINKTNNNLSQNMFMW